jgi:hypothetical protein
MLSTFFDKGHTPIRGYAAKYAMVANGTIVIPQGAVVRRIYIRNKTANAVTGGIRVGTTATGVDVHATIAVAGSAVLSALPLIEAINLAAARTLYVEAVTAWNSASLDVVIEYQDLV